MTHAGKNVFKSTFAFKSKELDPDKVAASLKHIASTGELTPDRVVQEAESPDSPLHEAFEWDDDKAAHEFRLVQARSLIRSICIKAAPGEPARPIYYRVIIDEDASYKPVSAVVRSADLYTSALEQLQEELESARRSVLELEQAAQESKSKHRAAHAARVRKPLEAAIAAAKG